MNHFKTYLLMAGLTTLFGVVGMFIDGATGMAFALLLGAGMNLFSYWNADKIVLKMYRAVEVPADHPSALVRNYLSDTLELARSAGMPAPKIYVIESEQPNAFATGRNPQNAAVAATTGLLQMLDRDEIRGVMAHELAHVKNRDTLTMTLTATIAGAISSLANFAFFFGGNSEEDDRPGGIIGMIAISLLAPIAAMLVQMAISRAREYEADKLGAEIASDPDALARALQKIEAYARGGAVNHAAERNPATAHMFIINPLSGQGADNPFSTHPATHNRVEALMKLSDSVTRPRSEISKTETAVPVSSTLAGRSGPWG